MLEERCWRNGRRAANSHWKKSGLLALVAVDGLRLGSAWVALTWSYNRINRIRDLVMARIHLSRLQSSQRLCVGSCMKMFRCCDLRVDLHLKQAKEGEKSRAGKSGSCFTAFSFRTYSRLPASASSLLRASRCIVPNQAWYPFRHACRRES